MNWWVVAGIASAAFVLGTGFGMQRSREWMLRFRYEAEHWYSVIKNWKDAYVKEHETTRALRGELVELHKRIAALTVKECEVLEWVSRSARRASEESGKSVGSSTLPSSTTASTTSAPSATSKSPEKDPST